MPIDEREGDGGDPGQQRDPGAVDEPAELVTAVAVDAEDVLRLGCVAAEQVDARRFAHLHARAEQHLVRPVRRDERGEHRHDDEQGEQHGTDLRRPLAQHLADGVAPQPVAAQHRADGDARLDLPARRTAP